MNIKQKSIQAFTLVELMIVVIIIGILAAVTIVSYNAVQSNSISTGLQSDLNNVSDLLRVDQANSSTGIFPTTLALANSGAGVPASPGTTYTYVYNNTNTPRTFCVTATRSGQNYHITQEGKPLAGVCPIIYFDMATPTSYPGTGTTITDMSGNGNNGTLLNGISYSSNNGGYLIFDGLTDAITIPDSASLKPVTSFTADVWINPTTDYPGYAAHPIAKWSTTTDANFVLYYFGTTSGANNEQISFYANAGGIWKNISSFYKLTLNKWTHVVVSYSSITGGQLYINGSPQGGLAGSGVLATNTQAMSIGESFPGQIGELSLYNKTLTSTEVSQNFNALRSRYGL